MTFMDGRRKVTKLQHVDYRSSRRLRCSLAPKGSGFVRRGVWDVGPTQKTDNATSWLSWSEVTLSREEGAGESFAQSRMIISGLQARLG